MAENFEQKVRQLLHDVQLEPHEEAWKNIRREIRPEKRKRRFIFWWLLPVALSGVGLIYFAGNYGSQKTVQTAQIPAHEKQVNDIPKTVDPKNVGNVQEINKEETGSNTSTVTVIQPLKLQVPVKVKRSGNTIQAYSNSNSGNSVSAKAVEEENRSTVVINNASPGNTTDPPVVTIPPTKNQNKKATDTVKAIVVNSDTIKSTPDVADTKQPKQQKSSWKFGITVKLGIAGSTTSPPLTTNTMASSIPTSGGSFSNGRIHQIESVQKDALFGAGLVARKDLSKNISLNGSISYEYQSFTLKHSFYKDSLFFGNPGTFQLGNSSSQQQFHFVNIAAGVSAYLISQKNAKIGISASMDNLLLLSSGQKKYGSYLTTNLSGIQQSIPVAASYNKWQPHLNLAIPVDFTLPGKKTLQLAPFFRYGVKPLNKQVAGNERLISFGISSTYFFR